MRVMILITLFISVLLGTEIKHSGYLEYFLINYKYNDVNKVYNKLETSLNNDITFDQHNKIYTTLTLSYLNDNMGNDSYVKEAKPTYLVYFNTLYYNYIFNKHNNISVGWFSFRKGTFYENSFNLYRMGNGLFTLISIDLAGISYNYRTCHTSTLFGLYVNNGLFNNTLYKNNIDNNIIKGTRVNTIIHKHKFDENNFVEINLYNIKQYIHGKDISTINLFGIGYEYDDSINTGIKYYTIGAVSDTKGDNTALSPTGKAYETDTEYYGKYHRVGYSLLLGIVGVKDAYLYNHDLLYGMESNYISPGFRSMTMGKPLESYSYTTPGLTNNIFIGIKFRNGGLVKLRYCNYYNTEGIAYKKGYSLVDGDNNDLGLPDHSQSISLMYYYNF